MKVNNATGDFNEITKRKSVTEGDETNMLKKLQSLHGLHGELQKAFNMEVSKGKDADVKRMQDLKDMLAQIQKPIQDMRRTGSLLMNSARTDKLINNQFHAEVFVDQILNGTERQAKANAERLVKRGTKSTQADVDKANEVSAKDAEERVKEPTERRKRKTGEAKPESEAKPPKEPTPEQQQSKAEKEAQKAQEKAEKEAAKKEEKAKSEKDKTEKQSKLKDFLERKKKGFTESLDKLIEKAKAAASGKNKCI